MFRPATNASIRAGQVLVGRLAAGRVPAADRVDLRGDTG
jgi:hypothetical protein